MSGDQKNNKPTGVDELCSAVSKSLLLTGPFPKIHEGIEKTILTEVGGSRELKVELINLSN
jgi:hypothetical protein